SGGERTRNNLAALDFLLRIIGDLEELHDRLMASPDGEPLPRPVTAMALAGPLRKQLAPPAQPPEAALAKLAGEILPRLDALQRRVDDIANTPLPPQTIARGFAGIAKHDDGSGPLAPADDIVAALACMSDEERTLVLIKAAHA